MNFYFDLFSQPSRALYIFFKLNNNIQTTYCPIALFKKEQRTKEYKAINRFQQVPCIVDNGFKLSETVAIFRYVMGTRDNIADHWYPKDLKSRALVDEYLEWHHNNTRTSCTPFVRAVLMQPLTTGKSPSNEELEEMKSKLDKTLDAFENIWLASDEKDFLASKDISFADILAACEMELPKVTGYNPFENRPKLAKWHQHVKNATSPYYEEAHAKMRKIDDWQWVVEV